MHFPYADVPCDVAQGGRKGLFVFWFEREVARRKKRRGRDGVVEFYFSPLQRHLSAASFLNKCHSGARPDSKRHLALRYRLQQLVLLQLARRLTLKFSHLCLSFSQC